MLTQLRNTVVALVVLTILTGIAYPLLVTAIVQIAFNNQSNGSLLVDGKGSALIGQNFHDPGHFWGRLSGAGYDAAASSATNFAMTNPAIVDAAKARIEALKQADPGNTSAIPVDLVTASGSGLDPHISVEAARYQAARVARVRGIDQPTINKLIDDHIERATFGLLGEPRVNVVLLNRAMDLR